MGLGLRTAAAPGRARGRAQRRPRSVRRRREGGAQMSGKIVELVVVLVAPVPVGHRVGVEA
jgi:hypothetical protein